MDAVDVLARIDRGENLARVEPARQRELNQDPVDGGIGVQLGDQRQQLGLRGGGRQAVIEGADPGLRAGGGLVADVDLRGGIFADQDHRQPRFDAAGAKLVDLLRQLCL